MENYLNLSILIENEWKWLNWIYQMKVKFMNFKEMAITQNTGMCSYLTIAWAVPYGHGQ